MRDAPSEAHSATQSPVSNSLLREVLRAQLEAGGSSDYNLYQYKESDLAVTIPILEEALAEGTYKPPAPETFAACMKKIFRRTVVPGSPKPYLCVAEHDACDTALVYAASSVEERVMYVVKSGRFITELYPLPEVLDYQRLYPESRA